MKNAAITKKTGSNASFSDKWMLRALGCTADTSILTCPLYKTYCIIVGMTGKAAKHGTKTYTAAEAREHFAKILDAVEQGEIVVITKHGTPVAQLTRAAKPAKAQIPPPGYLEAQGWKIKMAEDFDAIPEGFEDYI